ncbi:ergothioneine biosynthesis protein EgtB [Pedobacter alluvionis]|uniref:Ergothioneine biosynthesis protein EgtB n=1 Tax=Pedobacter alluvionis TaxID=475253 RepID=A0A497Y0G1_9SPHI|nr:ergothioneine biosynthesis protein EgtB [Pedobacter alluvionis]RLJ74954.1 ergothioneine biosynthesis protein EgtB [Pedobacter alluvionis]TFB30072.1 ergothioneine biosynthesis protein EgtB [Pedobacter alluvionis]
MTLLEEYLQIRKYSEQICEPLQTEDYVVQPVVDVSPPKWHLGHTTWFFETFILKPFSANYQVYNDDYNFVFNSYYETVGNRVIRTDRGNLSRPSVNEIYQYRAYVDEAMTIFLNTPLKDEVTELLVLGFNHEQQHQELLLTDIKYILGNNPLFPVYTKDKKEILASENESGLIDISAGIYEIGYEGTGFSFDNELNKHKVYLHDFAISKTLVSNAEFLEFIKAGGYENFNYWHSEGWDWVKSNGITSPMYWHLIDEEWFNYTLDGLLPIDPNAPVSHVSYYEAYAYASWSGMRLPTEFEWEVAAKSFNWGERWEWTESAYLPYPGFSKAPGAIGEYNGKFMVNQKVLRGASIATPQNHSRITYRNFFHPHLRWQYTGIRLVK